MGYTNNTLAITANIIVTHSSRSIKAHIGIFFFKLSVDRSCVVSCSRGVFGPKIFTKKIKGFSSKIKN
ncbi:hypothetical protein HanIR_Chr05g0240231 [Helianthus annuus]|nr:hypothetical protein HanIR_Chr05g0240231 [Helianthus annuus]